MLFINMVIDNTYQVIEEIGSGGMGVIYLAYHLRLEKYIVLKKIKNPYADISMLRNEVDILKDLHHPYLPQVYDFIEYQGDLYTVIDYINGYDLNYYINNGYSFSESQLIKWLRQLCEVLEYLHSQSPRILHTDIKPANIIITGTGDVCLIDFGISLYNTDVIKGLSEDYSSPEQYGNYCYLRYGTGEYTYLDERTDIYSLGATFYHLMSGVKPSVSDSAQLPLSQYRTEYSQTLVEIIDTAMSYYPQNRFRTAGEMLAALANMKKRDARYKKYLLVQILSSAVSVFLIAAGILLIVNGSHNQIVAQYESDYRRFTELIDKGEMSEAAGAGQHLLNEGAYKSLTDNSEKAKILRKIGDCYFEAGDNDNAAYYYKASLEHEKNDLAYRDCALALIACDKPEEAQALLSNLESEYAGSPAVAVVKAQLAFQSGDYKGALKTINDASGRLAESAENNYSANIIKGDAQYKLGSYSEAARAYEEAVKIKKTQTALRKRGNACLKTVSSYDKSGYQTAYECYEMIMQSFSPNTDDVIVFAQLCLDTEKTESYKECQQLLIKEAGRGEDCRVYMVLAAVSDRLGDARTAEYCETAHRLYNSLTADEAALISDESIRGMRTLYRDYCGREW